MHYSYLMRHAKHSKQVMSPQPSVEENKSVVEEHAEPRTVFTVDPNMGSPVTFITDQVADLIEVDTVDDDSQNKVDTEVVDAAVVEKKPMTGQGEFMPTDALATAVLDSIYEKVDALENTGHVKNQTMSHISTNTPVINQMISNQSNENAQKIDDMVSMISDALEYFIDKDSDLLTPNLATKQVDDVLNFMIDLQTNYFSDIPLTHRMSRPFLFGIPEKLYDEMEESIDHGESIVFNPMTYLYIMLVDEPRFAIGKFLKILMNLAYDQQNLINRYAAEYDEATTIDTDDEDVDDFVNIDLDDEDE